MKRWFKKILLIQATTIVIISSLSTNKSNWTGMNLTTDEMDNSIHFQLARGGNCKGEFEKLQPTLNRFIEKKLDASYLNNILGKFNNSSVTAAGTEYNYYLTEKFEGCSVSFIIKNASLVSYSFKNCNTESDINN